MMRRSTEQLRDKYLATGLATESDIAAYISLIETPDCWATGSVSGRRRHERVSITERNRWLKRSSNQVTRFRRLAVHTGRPPQPLLMVQALLTLVPSPVDSMWLTKPAGAGEAVHAVRQVATKSGAGPTDAALVIAARGGEDWAFEALFRRHANLVFGLTYRLLPRDSDVDDIVQDVFSAAFERLETLQNPQAFAAWLGSIVVNTVSKRLRRRRLLERLGLRSTEPCDPDQVVSPVAPVDAALELKAIYRLLQRLPTEQRVALVLRRVEGMEIAQIAEHMGLSASTVKRRLTAAEARLERARGK